MYNIISHKEIKISDDISIVKIKYYSGSDICEKISVKYPDETIFLDGIIISSSSDYERIKNYSYNRDNIFIYYYDEYGIIRIEKIYNIKDREYRIVDNKNNKLIKK